MFGLVQQDQRQAANKKDYHFVTWQPQANIRIAAVTAAAGNYYVLSGRIAALMVLGTVFALTRYRSR